MEPQQEGQNPTPELTRAILDGVINYAETFAMEVHSDGVMNADPERAGFILARVIAQQNNLAVILHGVLDRLNELEGSHRAHDSLQAGCGTSGGSSRDRPIPQR